MTARALTACREVEPLLSPCVDGELLDDDRAAVSAHVRSCDACRARLAAMESLKQAMARAPRPELPPGLEAQIRVDVRGVARTGKLVRGLVLGTTLAAALTATLWIAVPGLRAPAPAVPSPTPHVVTAVLQRHRLDLPVDVASPDPRRVQAFLAARALALRVPRLEVQGFGLQGARIVDVDDRRGAQMVYSGGYGQRLSVTALPDADGSLARTMPTPYATTSDGLAVRVIANGGAVYAFVGDVDEAKLERASTELFAR